MFVWHSCCPTLSVADSNAAEVEQATPIAPGPEQRLVFRHDAGELLEVQ